MPDEALIGHKNGDVRTRGWIQEGTVLNGDLESHRGRDGGQKNG